MSPIKSQILKRKVKYLEAELARRTDKMQRIRLALASETSVLERFDLERVRDEEEKEIQTLETLLAKLERALESNTFDEELDDDRFYKALLKLNYHNQERFFRNYLYACTCKFGAFLIQGIPEGGQAWLVHRLLATIPNRTSAKRISLDLSSRVRRKDAAMLWRDMSMRVGLLGNGPLTNGEKKLIVEKLAVWWQTQPVFIILDRIEHVADEEIHQFVDELCEYLKAAALAREQFSTNWLLLFLVDHEGYTQASGKWVDAHHLLTHPNFSAIKLPSIQGFAATDLEVWLDHSENLPQKIKQHLYREAQQLINTNNDGQPNSVFVHISQLCGYDWYDMEAKWLR